MQQQKKREDAEKKRKKRNGRPVKKLSWMNTRK